MTSPLNHDETRAYFEANDNFGLASVFFFQQGMLVPCLTTEGKIIVETAGQVAMAPDGNGGIYPALKLSGALDDMEQRKIEYLHIFSIDNTLVLPADPVFVGYCIHNNVECGNKSVWKSHAQEQVGVVAQRNGKPCIVEYSEITKNMAESTTENGTLLYGAGNICNHFYKVSFIRNSILPNMKNLYHLARKKIPHYNGTTTITPTTENNGIKLETFIFDVFFLAERSFCVLEVERRQEFAPVKNKSGNDSPDTARPGYDFGTVEAVRSGCGKLLHDDSVCEISLLTSYAGEGLDELVGGKELKCPFQL